MKIKEVELLTDCLEETVKFYSEVLGFEKLSVDTTSVSFKAGSSILNFRSSQNLEPKYHFAFTIPSNKLNEAIQWTSARTELIQIEEGKVIVDFPNWNAKSVYFYDNNGNILEFIARFGLANDSNIPFTGESIVSISEIGIATDNPLAFAEKMNKEYQVPDFPPGPKREDFVAMGTDEGLFVISKTTRHWYPTPIFAHSFLTRIKIEVNKKMSEITL